MAKKKKRKGMGKANSRNRQQRKSGRGWLKLPDGFSLFKEEAGETMKLDILPYIISDIKKHPDSKDIPEDIWWKMPYQFHRDVGPDKLTVICPESINKPCPICEERQAIWDDPDGDEDIAKSLNASKRGLYAVRPVDGKHKNKIMIWDISNFCFLDQLDMELEDGEEEWNDFADLEGGYTLKIRFKEEKIGKSSTFAKANRIDFIEREDEDEDILDETPDLQSCITVPSYDKVKAIFEGDSIDDDDKDEEETKKKPAKKKPAKKKPAKKKPAKISHEPELDWEDLIDMDESELWEVNEIEGLEIESDDYEDEEDLRNQIAEELDIEKPKKKKKEKKSKKSKKKKKEKKSKKIECPFAYKIGEDFEEKEECDEEECEMYEQCFDLYEKSAN